MKITENIEEMTGLGRQFLIENPDLFPEDFVKSNIEKFSAFLNDTNEIIRVLYRSVYYQQVYGTTILECTTFHFDQKNHDERTQYITWDSRFPYMAFLNKDSHTHILENKYEAYTFFKDFYKRDAMLLSDENDYPEFCAFVKKHPDVFVKPNNLELAEGVHRLEYDDVNDLGNTFKKLQKEASELSSVAVKRKIDHRLILEEYIRPSEFIRRLNPSDMSLLRVTTIFVKGKVHFFYPCLRLLTGDGKERKGEDYSYVALIDSESGKVITNGKNGLGDSDINPVTGEKICGIQMPEWEELKQMLTRAAQMIPEIRYIGWDVTHTDKGWCIIEGNNNGEFFYQMCLDHGVKKELEDLIGFHIPYDFRKHPILHNNNYVNN